jgi:hypothetical protein
MTQTLDIRTIAVFAAHRDAEDALLALQHGNFDMNKISILGRGYDDDALAAGLYSAGERVKYWGTHGAFWGAVFGMLVAPAALFIAGIGPISSGGVAGSLSRLP